MAGEQMGGSGNKDKRLNANEAQDEANMLRADIGVNPYYKHMKKDRVENTYDYIMRLRGYELEREPTAKDYEAASAALDELRELAEKETDTEKVFAQLGRIMAHSGKGVGLFLIAFGSVVMPFGDKRFERQANKEEHKSLMERFSDASYELKQLQKSGQKWGKEEKDWR